MCIKTTTNLTQHSLHTRHRVCGISNMNCQWNQSALAMQDNWSTSSQCTTHLNTATSVQALQSQHDCNFSKLEQSHTVMLQTQSDKLQLAQVVESIRTCLAQHDTVQSAEADLLVALGHEHLEKLQVDHQKLLQQIKDNPLQFVEMPWHRRHGHQH
jgi:hypothetical protein